VSKIGDSKDISEELPDVKIPVWVMLKGRDLYLNVKDPFPSNGRLSTNILCNLEMGLLLPSDRKGIHVSRIEDKVFKLSSGNYETLKEFYKKLVEEIIKSQPAESSKVIVNGIFLRTIKTPQSKIETHQRIMMKYASTLTGGEKENELEIRLPVFIACPSCMRTLQSFDEAVGYATHSQKAYVGINISSKDSIPTPEELVGSIEKVSTVLAHLLKRSDEGHIVLEALKKPQYVEDLSRELIGSIYRNYADKINGDAKITVTVDSQESIHPHDIGARISARMKDIAHLM